MIQRADAVGVSTVKSAARVLEVLELFARLRTPLQLKQIAEALRYPQSSTTVLLKSLIALGYLNYDRATRVYFPTLRVASLGDWVSDALFGQRRAIEEAMRDLHSATGETVSIVVLNDIYVQYIRVIQSTHALRFHTEEGSMRPLTQTAMGWLLLTDRTPAEADKLIRRANIAVAKASERVTPERILREVEDARARRSIYVENTPFLGGATIGVVLPCRLQGRVPVLGMGGSVDRIRPHRARYTALMKRLVEQLAEPAQGIKT